MNGISKSQISRLCMEIDDKIQSFLERPLEGDWPYLWLDATFVKVRQTGRIVSVAVTVAVAVNDQGRREMLGMTIGASEAETFWTEFLRSPARRGVQLVISDDHKGLKAAVTRVLGATWQRCRVHFTCWPMPVGRAGASSRPWPRTTPIAPLPSGARSPTSSGPRRPSSLSSWTRPSMTSWRT